MRRAVQAVGRTKLLLASASSLVVGLTCTGCSQTQVPQPVPQASRGVAPIGDPTVPNLTVTPVTGGTAYTANDAALFDFDSATLLSSSKVVLDRIVHALPSSGFYLTIAGYTDGVGKAAYNYQLSGRRANAVWSYLEAAISAAAQLGQQDVPLKASPLICPKGETGVVNGRSAVTGRADASRRVVVVTASAEQGHCP